MTGAGRGRRGCTLLQPVLAGVVTALVGFASSFTVVLAGLRAVGATSAQAASGLLALCVATGVGRRLAGSGGTGCRSRIAWSTPGAALLVATGAVAGGLPAAVGAFLVSRALIIAAGLFPRWAARSPPSPLRSRAPCSPECCSTCASRRSARSSRCRCWPVPVVLTWALLNRFARQWAVPGALLVAVVAIALTGPGLGAVDVAARSIEPTLPSWNAPAMISIALPLFLVTMAAQNVPGMAVWPATATARRCAAILLATGLASALGAPLGGHAVNLAAITAALAAGPDADPDPGRRWIASVTAGGR